MGLTQRDRELLAGEFASQAVALRMKGQAGEAIEFADKGVALVEGLLEERPKDPGTLHVLAEQLYNRAAIYEQLGRPARGVADARRSAGLYQRLIPLDDFIEGWERHAEPGAADAEARLARLIALAPGDAVPGGAQEARAAIGRAVATYSKLAEADPRHLPGLARLKFSQGEVLRLLAEADGAPPADALAAYLKAVRLYYDLSKLISAGQNWNEEWVEALYLLGEYHRDLGFPNWTDPLRQALSFLALMRRPLSDQTAQLEREIQLLLDPKATGRCSRRRAARTHHTRWPRRCRCSGRTG